MSTVSPIVQAVIEESKQEAGTWSYAFLSDIFKSIRKLRTNEYNKFFELVLNYMKQDDTTQLQKFKLAQLLSSTNQQNPGKATQFLSEKQPEIMKFAETCIGSPLLQAAKKLILGLFTVHAVPATKTRYTSSSTEPTIHTSGDRLPKSSSTIFKV